MKIEKVETKEAYDLSPHKHAFINPYNGCSMGCPFCYWLTREGWENRIQVRTNIAQVLEEQLGDWDRNQTIYLGSVCDPYNELEDIYGLSRKCLEIIKRKGIPLLITTSCVRDIILRDLDLLREMDVIIAVELARIPMIKKMYQGGEHLGIKYANRLKAEGLQVYATLAPICPGVIELEPVMERLNPEIPIYIDCLRCEPEGILAKRTKDWIRMEHPELMRIYENIIDFGDDQYFQDIQNRYKGNGRIKYFPFELDFKKKS